jgi:hypothetical protein
MSVRFVPVFVALVLHQLFWSVTHGNTAIDPLLGSDWSCLRASFFVGIITMQSPKARQSNNSNTPTADDMMVSALSSLLAQLGPVTLSIGNCCSNFHVLLNDLLLESCGAGSSGDYDHTFRCLQETANPMLMVCCGWRKECHRLKAAAVAAAANSTSPSIGESMDGKRT